MGKNSFFGWFGHNEESPTDWWSSKFSMVLLCPPFSSLLPLFFDGKLSGSKYSRVCALYAEKEQQCLAAGVACRFSHEISSWRQDNYISTGIYRCSILDFDVKFCENFKVSRISADKRFSLCHSPALNPATGASMRPAEQSYANFLKLTIEKKIIHTRPHGSFI